MKKPRWLSRNVVVELVLVMVVAGLILTTVFSRAQPLPSNVVLIAEIPATKTKIYYYYDAERGRDCYIANSKTVGWAVGINCLPVGDCR